MWMIPKIRGRVARLVSYSIFLGFLAFSLDAGGGLEDFLQPADYRIFLRAAVVTEDVLKELADHPLRAHRDSPLFAMHPDTAAGNCGEAMELLGYALHLQGWDYKRMAFFQLRGERGLLGPNSFQHVVLTYPIVDRKGTPRFLMGDASFTQLYTYRAREMDALRMDRLGIDGFKRSIAYKLARSLPGREILAELESSSGWVVTPERLEAWADAMTAGPDGKLRARVPVKIEDLNSGNYLIQAGTVERRVADLTGLTRNEFLKRIEAVDEDRLELRALGHHLFGTQRAGLAFLDEKSFHLALLVSRARREWVRYHSEDDYVRDAVLFSTAGKELEALLQEPAFYFNRYKSLLRSSSDTAFLRGRSENAKTYLDVQDTIPIAGITSTVMASTALHEVRNGALRELAHRPTSFSKYVAELAELVGDLPGGRSIDVRNLTYRGKPLFLEEIYDACHARLVRLAKLQPILPIRSD